MNLNEFLQQVLFNVGSHEVTARQLISWGIVLIVTFAIYQLSIKKFLPKYFAQEKYVIRDNSKIIRSIRNKRTGFSLLAPVPVAALRLAMGEMADVVLSSTLVSSKKIQERGFKFKYETINQAIQALQDASFG